METITTERLVLRHFADTDAASLFALHNDPEVMRFLSGEATSRERIEAEVLPRLRREYDCFGSPAFWAAEERTTGTFVGWFLLRPFDEASAAAVELGYRLHKAAWGHGYATEGSLAMISRAFTELGVERITAFTMAVNLGSRRVMEKVGLTFVRNFTADWPDVLEGSEHGEVEYALTRSQWERRRAQAEQAVSSM